MKPANVLSFEYKEAARLCTAKPIYINISVTVSEKEKKNIGTLFDGGLCLSTDEKLKMPLIDTYLIVI